MNLGLIFKNVGTAARKFGSTGMLIAKKHAPEIMVTSGVIGFVVTIVEACKATSKTHDILEKKDEVVEAMNDRLSDSGDHYDTVMYTNDMANLNKRVKWNIVKSYIPTVTTGVASVILVLSGYRIINGRYIGAAAAYKTLEAGFERYRGNVIDEFGQEVDWRMLNNVKPEDYQAALKERDENREIIADNKRKKIFKKRPRTRYNDIYSKWFDEYSDRWRRWWTADQVLDYIKQKQREANDKLNINKHLFLNEVYDSLGLDRTPEGQLVGWIVTKSNPNSHVDFGLNSMPADVIREILGTRRNEEIRVPLTFNPDGVIYQLIDEKGDDLSYYNQ